MYISWRKIKRDKIVRGRKKVDLINNAKLFSKRKICWNKSNNISSLIFNMKIIKLFLFIIGKIGWNRYYVICSIMIFRYFHLLLNLLEHFFFIMIHLQIFTIIACVNVWLNLLFFYFMEYTIFSLTKNKEIKSHENKDSEFLNSVEYFDSDPLIICTAKSDKQK